MSKSSTSLGGLYVLEALAGWVVPGLGHALIGERRRGVILGSTILGLWGLGILVGGIPVVDHRALPEGGSSGGHRNINILYAGQVLVGPSVMVQWVRQFLPTAEAPRVGDADKEEIEAAQKKGKGTGGAKAMGTPGGNATGEKVWAGLAYSPTFGRPYEVGSLYVAVAGLLNGLVMLDVCYFGFRQRRKMQGAESQTAGQASFQGPSGISMGAGSGMSGGEGGGR